MSKFGRCAVCAQMVPTSPTGHITPHARTPIGGHARPCEGSGSVPVHNIAAPLRPSKPPRQRNRKPRPKKTS
jgi:hypothetical protein